MLDIHLFGTLRKLAKDSKATDDSTIELPWKPEETIKELLERLKIGPDDVGEVFINHKPVGLSKKIPKNARIGLFSSQMYLLCGGQHMKGHGFITKKRKNAEYWNEENEDKN